MAQAAAGRIAPGPGISSMVHGVLTGGTRRLVQGQRAAWRTYGDVVRFGVGSAAMHLFVHPDHVNELVTRHRETLFKGNVYNRVRQMIGLGLVTSEGQLWRRQRQLLQPRFSSRAVQQFGEAMTRCTQDMLQEWEHTAGTGHELTVDEEMMRLTMRIIALTMLGLDLGARQPDGTEKPDVAALTRAFEYAIKYMGERSGSTLSLPLWVPLRSHRRFRTAMRYLDDFVYRLIETRRRQLAGGEAPEDLVTVLLQAKDAESGQPIDDRQIRDEIMTVFLAGHETTALTLAWTWHTLALQTEIERRLHAELESVLGGRPPTPADLPQLPYVRAIVNETLRLYPPAWIFPRNASQDDVVAGYRIPKGSMLLFSPYLSHRHPEFWPDPERFDPERFLGDDTAGVKLRREAPYAYFPFGIGHRTCIGNHFALLEAQLVLATAAQRFSLRYAADATPAEPTAIATLRPDRPMIMRLEPRQVPA